MHKDSEQEAYNTGCIIISDSIDTEPWYEAARDLWLMVGELGEPPTEKHSKIIDGIKCLKVGHVMLFDEGVERNTRGDIVQLLQTHGFKIHIKAAHSIAIYLPKSRLKPC